MPVLKRKRDYCVSRFKHTIIPIVENLSVGQQVADAFLKAFEIKASWGDDNVLSRRIAVNERSINLHLVFLDSLDEIANAVFGIYEKRKIDENDEVGVILQGRNSAGNILASMAKTIDEKTGAHVCVW